MDVDIRYLPDQDPGDILEQIRDDRRHRGRAHLHPPAGLRLALEPVRASRCREAVGAARPAASRSSVGRDGASDAVSFLEAGIPAVEFGPAGGGHHGPEEWVSIPSLARYRAGARPTSSRTLPDAALDGASPPRAARGGAWRDGVERRDADRRPGLRLGVLQRGAAGGRARRSPERGRGRDHRPARARRRQDDSSAARAARSLDIPEITEADAGGAADDPAARLRRSATPTRRPA